ALRFGPDGHLYVGLGDDGTAFPGLNCAARDRSILVGKILRLDVGAVRTATGSGPPSQATITPAGNPFSGPNAQLVYSSGLRNPFRFNIDAPTGNLLVADVGGQLEEEWNLVTGPGQDFGWPFLEGVTPSPFAPAQACNPNDPHTLPIYAENHPVSNAAVTLGGLPLAVEPVEALIALSVVLLARELVHASGPTTTVKTSIATHPWRMASLFGLVHGCGFAGALTEIGLPPGTFAVALAAFNIGVELGQLAVVAGLLIILLPLFAGLPPRLHRYLTVTAGYCLGIVASAWTLARILAFWNQP
ncbi:MAG: HupE/UreJ family protein, partial [Nannocystaceae bacterium]